MVARVASSSVLDPNLPLGNGAYSFHIRSFLTLLPSLAPLHVVGLRPPHSLRSPSSLTRSAPQLGALLAIYGILVKLMPLLFPAPGAHGGDGGTESGAATVPWIALLVFSQGFNAASNVYKEVALKGVDLDEWYVEREVVVV